METKDFMIGAVVQYNYIQKWTDEATDRTFTMANKRVAIVREIRDDGSFGLQINGVNKLVFAEKYDLNLSEIALTPKVLDCIEFCDNDESDEPDSGMYVVYNYGNFKIVYNVGVNYCDIHYCGHILRRKVKFLHELQMIDYAIELHEADIDRIKLTRTLY